MGLCLCEPIRPCIASSRNDRQRPKRSEEPIMNLPRISVFPKCYFDDLYSGRMDYATWIRDAATLGSEGVEHYDGFFRSLDDAGVEPIRRVLAETNQISSMLCFSPDFTHPDAAERQRQFERQCRAIDLCV